MSLQTSLEPVSVAVDPGGTGAATLRLRNDGDTVEEYQLTVLGAPAAWTRVEPAVVRLFPGTRGQAELTFSPPRSPAAVAGLMPYGIQVRSRQNQAVFDVAEGSLALSAYGDVRAELFPLTVTGRLSGRSGVTVRNLGNAPLEAAIQARDDENVLGFRPDPPVLRVAPGGSASANIKILPRGLRLLRGKTQHGYAVTVAPSAAGATGLPDRLETRGNFVRLPAVPRLLLLLLVLLAVGSLLGTGIYYVANRLRDVAGQQAAPQVQIPQQQQQQQPPAQPPAQQQQQTQQPEQTQEPEQQQTTAAPPPNVFAISLAGSDLRLGVSQGQVFTGATADQLWTIVDTGDGKRSLLPAQGQALAQENNGDRVQIEPDAQADRRRWNVSQDNGTFSIVNVATGDCLSANGENRTATAVACEDDRADRQRWTLTAA